MVLQVLARRSLEVSVAHLRESIGGQALTAAGAGRMAGLEAERYLEADHSGH